MGFTEQGIVLLPCGTLWRERRKLLHQMVSKSVMTHFHPEFQAAVRQLLVDTLKDPVKFTQNLRL